MDDKEGLGVSIARFNKVWPIAMGDSFNGDPCSISDPINGRIYVRKSILRCCDGVSNGSCLCSGSATDITLSEPIPQPFHAMVSTFARNQ